MPEVRGIRVIILPREAGARAEGSEGGRLIRAILSRLPRVRSYIKGHEKENGPRGYVTLEFENEKLTGSRASDGWAFLLEA